MPIMAPIGRILLAQMFIIAGLLKVTDIPATMDLIESGGLPGILAYPVIALELVAGIMIMVGYKTRPAAQALAVFTLVAGVLYHLNPAQTLEGTEQQLQMMMFFKNVSIAGALLFLAAVGPGPMSIIEENPEVART